MKKLIILFLATVLLTACSAGGGDIYASGAPLTIRFGSGDNYDTYKQELVKEIIALKNGTVSERDITNPGLAESSGLFELTEFYYPNIVIDGYYLQMVTIERGGFGFVYSSAAEGYVTDGITITTINPKVEGQPYVLVPPSASLEELAETYRNAEIRDSLVFAGSENSPMVIGLLENTRFYIQPHQNYDDKKLHSIARLIMENAEKVTI
jgi:hypothetical protein